MCFNLIFFYWLVESYCLQKLELFEPLSPNLILLRRNISNNTTSEFNMNVIPTTAYCEHQYLNWPLIWSIFNFDCHVKSKQAYAHLWMQRNVDVYETVY